ncbi:MAG: 6-carboxytetrahydropterin synthase [bacterium]
MIKLTKIYTFSSAHRVFNPSWSEEKNLEVFGKCSHKNGHGHNYTLEVTVSGDTIDPETGFLISLSEIDNAVNDQIIELFDHKNINIQIPHFQHTIPSAENILTFCWKQLKPHLPQLQRLTLHETINNKFTYSDSGKTLTQ